MVNSLDSRSQAHGPLKMVPNGGWKKSGYGRFNGAEGIQEFTQTKVCRSHPSPIRVITDPGKRTLYSLVHLVCGCERRARSDTVNTPGQRVNACGRVTCLLLAKKHRCTLRSIMNEVRRVIRISLKYRYSGVGRVGIIGVRINSSGS